MFKQINVSRRKIDSVALTTGKPVYTLDIAPKDCLIVKLVRSPYAFAKIIEVDKARAQAVDGIACILTYEDVPNERFTLAGQSYPEPSPYDRLILDQIVRYVGDPVAIIAGETNESIEQAEKLLKIKYEQFTPVLDFRTAKDNEILVHPEDNWRSLVPFFQSDNKRNLVAHGSDTHGDVDGIFAKADVIVDETYHSQACQQAHMETYRTFTQMDTYGRLKITSSTQIPFHVRRIIANALCIPKSKIRVIKPRIGGGFGAKQTAICEMYPAVVTWKTGKPALLVFTRNENLVASSPRHEMEVRVRIAATKDGKIQAIDMYALSNSGAFGEHGPTTVGLTGHKSIPMYRTEAFRFAFDVVYTNVMAAGAYRGYGATQGIFALESAVDELAHKLHIDPVLLRFKNMVHEGDLMPAYYNSIAESCALDRCLEKAKNMIGWEEKGIKRVLANGKIRAIGCAMAMQGSGISLVDQGSARIKLEDDGMYSLHIGATDMGTGCDTILAQIAAQTLECELEDIAVHAVDTDVSPYDAGSYASSTTYVTGYATMEAAKELRTKIIKEAAHILKVNEEDLVFDGVHVYDVNDTSIRISRAEIGNMSMSGDHIYLVAEASRLSPGSPPPFMAGFAEIEIDPKTGLFDLINYAAVVDCGTIVNPSLARVQAEGGIAQGIGMAMFEEVNYSKTGKIYGDSFMTYKIPNRMDYADIRVEFEESYEPTGPYGAKSIGEIVINTPSPAIANAIENAVGVRIRNLPITAEKVFLSMQGVDVYV